MGTWISTIKWRSLHESVHTRGWRPVLSAGSLAVLAFGLYLQFRPQSFHACIADFNSFYNAAVTMRNGANPYARLAAWNSAWTPSMGLQAPFLTPQAPCGEARFNYVYPPIFALLLTPLSWLPRLVVGAVWDVCNVVFLLGAIYAFLRAANIRPSLHVFLLLAAAASLMNPVRIELYYAQADLFILFLICAALWMRIKGKPGLAGILLALACVVKPPLLFVAAVLLWKREFKFAVATTAGFIGLLLIPFLWLGSQALRDMLAIWQFMSTHYLINFDYNFAPKTVFARLFTVNDAVRPLFIAPVLASILWIALAAAVILLVVAIVAPQPLRSDSRSLMEFGFAISALFFLSPMAEDNHFVLMIVPLLAFYAWLREGHWRSPGLRSVALMSITVWLLLCGPLHQVHNFFWSRIGTHSIMADMYMLLSLTYLYVLIGLFALQLYAMYVMSGRSTVVAVRQLVSNFPAIMRAWLSESTAALALPLAGRPSGDSSSKP